MAKIANTRKVFNFVIEIDGVNQFEFQKFKVPEREIEVVTHGDVNSDVKTAGRVKTGEGTFEKLKPLPTTDNWAFDWMERAQSDRLGTGGLAGDYKRIVIVKEMHPNGILSVNRWMMEGCWISKLSQNEFDRNSSDNVMQTGTFQVDKCYSI